MKRFFLALCLLAVTLTAADQSGSELYMKCAPCHGHNGDRIALGQSKKISRLTADEIYKALQGYKSGEYGGPMKRLMRSQACDLSAAQMVELANFIGKGKIEIALEEK